MSNSNATENIQTNLLENYQIFTNHTEKVFNQIAETAANVTNTKKSCISFFKGNEKFVKGMYGAGSQVTANNKTLCHEVVNSTKLIYFKNIQKETEYIKGIAQGTKTFLGVQIQSESGVNIGALCVFDSNEVKINDSQIKIIEGLARQISSILDLRKENKSIESQQKSVEHVLNNITEGFWDWHLEQDYEYLSPKLWEQLGYDPKTKKHHPSEWQKIIHPDYFKVALESFNNHIESKGKDPFKVDLQYKHAKGHWHWIRCEGKVISWDEDRPVRVVGTHKDIHEQKNIEKIELLIKEIQTNYIHERDSNSNFFNYFLEKLVEITESEYAFIGEILYKNSSTPYLKTFALTDISWNNETAEFYRKNADIGVEFFNMDTLFGEVITSGKELITNDPQNHPSSSGTPQGHPELKAFLGVPFFFQGELIGMIGLANRSSGYSQSYYQKIEKIFQLCSELIGNYRLNRKLKEVRENKIQEFEKILSATPSCLKIVDKKGRLIKMNQQGLELIGAKNMQEVQDTFVAELIEENHREEWIKFHKSVCEGLSASLRFEIITLDGKKRWMETHAAPFKLENGKTAQIAITNDITKNLKNQKKNEFILQTMKVGTWEWSIPEDIFFWDDANYKVYGISKDYFKGTYKGWIDILHPDYKDEIHHDLEQALEKEDEYNAILPIQIHEETRYIGAKAVIIRDKNKNAIKMFGINWDRTKEHKLSLELEEQKKVSYHNSKLISLGELAAGIGHEINNPMAIISGNREVIEQEISKKEINKDIISNSVDKIKNSVDRIKTIVDGLKTFSRIDENSFEIFDLHDLLNETSNLIRELYQLDGLTIEIELVKPEPIFIKGIRGRIQQVIINLLNNAKDAVEKSKNKTITIKVEYSSRFCTVAIIDRGIGIPSSLQHKIFDPFFTSKDVNRGTGIGLSLCHKIMREHLGEISFSSAPESGTTFYLEFPLADPQENQAVENDEPEEKKTQTNKEYTHNSRGHVLLADDEEDLRDIIKFFLESAGFTVFLAANGLEAYEEYQNNEEKYDLLITDLKMPKMDGIELVTKLTKEKKADSKLKIIIMTGGINHNYEDKNSELGTIIDGYLAKPFTQEDLLEVIDNFFPNTGDLAS